MSGGSLRTCSLERCLLRGGNVRVLPALLRDLKRNASPGTLLGVGVGHVVTVRCSTTNNAQHKRNSRRFFLRIASATAISTLFYPGAPAVAIPLAPLGKVGVPTGGKKLRLTVDEAKVG